MYCDESSTLTYGVVFLLNVESETVPVSAKAKLGNFVGAFCDDDATGRICTISPLLYAQPNLRKPVVAGYRAVGKQIK